MKFKISLEGPLKKNMVIDINDNTTSLFVYLGLMQMLSVIALYRLPPGKGADLKSIRNINMNLRVR